MTADVHPDAFQAGDDPGALMRRSVHGAAATFAAQIAKFVVQFGSQIALARLLSPAEFGLVAMVAPVVALVQLFNDFGLSQAVIQRPRLSHRELSALFWVNVGVSAALALAMAAAAPLVAWFYGEPRTAGITAALAALLVLSGLSSQQVALMNRRMRFLPLAVIDIACVVTGAAAGIAGALAGLGYWSLVLMQAVNSATTVALAWALSDWRPSRPRREPGLVALLRFGGDVTGFNLVSYFAGNLDNVLIGAVSGGAALGLYDRAYRLMLLPMFQIMTPMSRVAVPLLSRLRDAPDRYREAYLRMLQAVLLLTAPGIVVAIALAGPVVETLLGAEWRGAAPILAWLGVGVLTGPVSHSTPWLFISQDRTRPQLWWGTLGAGLIVLSFLVGMPWGPVGVAASYAAFSWVQSPLLWWGVTRRGPVGPGAFAAAIIPVYLGAAASGAALRVLGGTLQLTRLAGLALAVALSYAVTDLVLLALPQGRRILGSLGALRTLVRRSES